MYSNNSQTRFCGRRVKALAGKIKFNQLYFFRAFSRNADSVEEKWILSLGVEFEQIKTSLYYFDLRVAYGAHFRSTMKASAARATLVKVGLDLALQKAHNAKKAKSIMKKTKKEQKMANLIQYKLKNG